MASEFVRRFLQHVLPTGFQKVRHYGFLSPNSRISLDLVRWLIALLSGLGLRAAGQRPPQEARPGRGSAAPLCGGPMIMSLS